MSDLEASFDYHWRVLNGPPLESEYRFYPRRKWRFDRVQHQTMVAIEIDGGIYQQGRHNRAAGYTNDCEKLNVAALLGWTVFRLTQPMIENEPSVHLSPIIQFIQNRRIDICLEKPEVRYIK